MLDNMPGQEFNANKNKKRVSFCRVRLLKKETVTEMSTRFLWGKPAYKLHSRPANQTTVFFKYVIGDKRILEAS